MTAPTRFQPRPAPPRPPARPPRPPAKGGKGVRAKAKAAPKSPPASVRPLRAAQKQSVRPLRAAQKQSVRPLRAVQKKSRRPLRAAPKSPPASVRPLRAAQKQSARPLRAAQKGSVRPPRAAQKGSVRPLRAAQKQSARPLRAAQKGSVRTLRAIPGGGGSRPQALPSRLRPATPSAPPVRRRLIVLLVLLSLAFGAVLGRLIFIQGFSARRYAVFGESQRLHTIVLPAARGAILDRNGAELAVSTTRQTVWADPTAVTDPAGTARALAPLLEADELALREKLRTSETSFVYLARKVEDRVADQIRRLDLDGIQLMDEPKRIVPSGDLAAPVLGQVGLDDEGLSGLEKQYEKTLTGTAGELLVERDPGGNDIAAGLRELKPSVGGQNLVLTLDRTMQYETERALAASIVSSKAKGGMALVMEPTTGEILAMANLVAGKPGSPPVPPADNMAVTRVFEPGSTNKVVTIAGAIEEGVVGPATHMNVADTLPVADVTFHDSEPHPLMWWTTADILAHSSNVGTIQIAQRLGKARIDRYLRAFGLDDRTELRFPGESGGLLPEPDEWSGTSMGSIPIGQGVAVTALQMLSAYNTIANGGMYVAPSLVKGTVDADGEVHPAKEPATRRVVSEATAAEMTRMLARAVEQGTGTAARIDGYTVAGKTGTARKPSETTAGYSDSYMASFVGFLPAEAPRFSAIVVLDEPTPYYGGVVSAPVFAALGSFGIRHFSIPALPAAPATTLGASPTRP